MNSMSWGSRVWWETDQSLQVQLQAEVSKVVVIVVFIVIVILVYTHMDIRITHKYNTVYFCKAKYE